jgi:hypothetical protein
MSKFSDRNFTQYKDAPEIIKVEDKLYVALYQYGMNEELLNHHIYSKVIIPEVLEVRRKLLNDPLSPYAIEDVNDPCHYIAIAQDGASGQIKATAIALSAITHSTFRPLLLRLQLSFLANITSCHIFPFGSSYD